MCTYFKTEIENHSIGKISSDKKICSHGLSFWKKRKIYLQNLTKEWKQPPVVILQQATFLQYMYSMLVDKNHQKIQSRCLAHEFSFTDIFNNINDGYKAALLKKIIWGCFQFIWMWLLIVITKTGAERMRAP